MHNVCRIGIRGHKPLPSFHLNTSMFALVLSIHFRLVFTFTMGSNASIMLQQEDLQNICQQTGWLIA